MALFFIRPNKIQRACSMIRFIIGKNPIGYCTYHIHNATLGCEDLPKKSQQIFLGFFNDFELAHRRAKEMWPKENFIGCQKCCEI